MKSCIAALLLGISSAAMAQSATMPDCWPSNLGGTGTVAKKVSDANGQAWSWWCGSKPTVLVALWSYDVKLPNTSPTNMQAFLSDMWALNVGATMTPEMGVLASAAQANMAADRPPEQVWTVATNGTSTTRPSYTVVAGALKVSTVRATVGATCDCNTKLVQGTTTYCAVPPNPTLAICKVK